MPFLIASIAGALLSVAASLVGRILIALGMGVVSYVGISAGLSYFRGTFNEAVGSGGSMLAGIMGTLQLDVCLSIFVAAGLAKLAIAGASSGTLKRMALK